MGQLETSRADKVISIENVEEWTRDLVGEVKLYTIAISTTEETPAVDAHLLHLWEASRALTSR